MRRRVIYARRRPFANLNAATERTTLKRISRVCTIAALVAALAPAANAQTFYTSLATFNANATTNTVFDFEGIASTGNLVANPNLSPLTVSVSGGSVTDAVVVNATYNGGVYSLNGTDHMVAGYADGSLPTTTIAFGSLQTAFGTEFEFVRNGDGAMLVNTFSLQLFNGATAVGSTIVNGSFGVGFFGVTSATPFDRVAVSTTGALDQSIQSYDNLRLGSVVVVPEVDSLALILAGLTVGATLVRRKRGRNNSH